VKLLLATNNEHKRRELGRLLPGHEIASLPDSVRLPPEDGLTFEANALEKARSAARVLGVATIAEDSGIEAAALDGAPGVRSARYAGEVASEEENLQRLIAEVPVGSPLEYVCVLVYVDCQASVERTFEGRCRGRMAPTRRGGRGFGYDPVFLAHDGPAGLTMAELSDEQKDAISHRGRAARALQRWLAAGATGG
jgi:XTP/dITP diphosphohydrolase